MIGLSWHIQMQSCLLQNTLTFWLLHQNPRDVHGGNELQSPSYFTKKATHLHLCQESVHSLHPATPAKMNQKHVNDGITLLPSMQDWTVCYQHLSARFFWTRPRKGDLPCRSTNLHVWATKVLRKGSVSWCLPSKMREERLILAIAEGDILNDSVCFWLHSGKCVIIRFCACSIRFRFRFSRQRGSGCILGCRVGS